jgi:speckle-type POZ protein
MALFKLCVYSNHEKINKYYKESLSRTVSERQIPTQPTLDQDFEYLYLNPLLSDIELVIDDKTLKAHKSVLLSRSTVFRELFQIPSNAAINRFIIKGFDLKTIIEMLRFMYCEKVEKLETIASELLRAAKKVFIVNLNLNYP